MNGFLNLSANFDKKRKYKEEKGYIFMRKRFIVFFSALLIFVYVPVFPSKQVSVTQVLDKMLRAIQNVKAIKYTLHSKERIKGNIFSATSHIKISEEKPKKIYFKNPAKGLEVLWVDGENKNDALVYPNMFPYVTMSLDPYKSIMRKNQHHTIFDLGYLFIGSNIANTILKSTEDLNKYFKLIGSVNSNGNDCYHIYYEYTDYKLNEYIVQKGETVRGISVKLNIGEYRIRERNPELMDTFGYVKEGKKLIVPNNYSSKTIIYIDKKTFLPLFIMVYDDQGFYESYEYSELEINPTFNLNEFSKGFPGYKI